MKKVFVAVGMNGRSDEEIAMDIFRAHDNIRNIVRDRGIEPFSINVIDNFDCEYEGEGEPSRLWYLGEAIKKLGTCDTCYFVKGWQDYKGCRAEYEVCKIYGIDIIEERS